jgi:soluble P-type ATPase
MADEKNARIYLRISSDEKSEFLKKSAQAKMNLSEYILHSAKNSKIILVDDLPKLVVEIIRIGTNINQIARVANAQKHVGKAHLQMLENDMAKIQQQLNAIIKKINAPETE